MRMRRRRSYLVGGMVREMLREYAQVIREFFAVARELAEVTLDRVRPRLRFMAIRLKERKRGREFIGQGHLAWA